MPSVVGFELIFAIPSGEHDHFALSDAVFRAGYTEAIVGTGTPGRLAVEIASEGDEAPRSVMNLASDTILQELPQGSGLLKIREIHHVDDRMTVS